MYLDGKGQSWTWKDGLHVGNDGFLWVWPRMQARCIGMHVNGDCGLLKNDFLPK